MAFEIVIYNDNNYMNSLIESSLKATYKDAYVRTYTNNDELISELIDYKINLYDNFNENITSLISQCKDDTNIPLFILCGNTHIIDEEIVFRQIHLSIKDNNQIHSQNLVPPTQSGKLNMLVSLVSPDDREQFIRDTYATQLSPDSMYIRYDLGWGLLYPSDTSGIEHSAMSQLIAKCTRRMKAKQILEYLNPDTNGFLTPGSTGGPDDIDTIGMNACMMLLGMTKELIDSEKGKINALAVIEIYKTSDILSLTKFADDIIVLLPKKNSCNSINEQNLINRISETLNPEAHIKVKYINHEAT